MTSVSFSPRGRPEILLEGRLIDGEGPACVISHPHPLAGGDMNHPIVESLWRAAGDAGFCALRYNFRGVGESTGRLTKTSPLAIADLAGAIDFMDGPVLAIGYSYGARTTLHALFDGIAIERAALVSLPTRLPGNRAAMSNLLLGRPIRTEEYIETPDLELIASAPRPVAVFAGDHDPLVQAAELEARGVTPWLHQGVNHFFARRLGNQAPDKGDLQALADAVMAFLGRRTRG